MTSPVCLSQRSPSSSCSLPVEVRPKSFDSALVLRERNGPLSRRSRNDYLDSLDGSFCDTETLDDSSYEGDYEIPDLKLVRKIVTQVEFYLSDENLSRDAFLLKHVQKNKMGYVSIKLLTSFKKVKYLTRDWRKTLYALQFSDLLEVNEEGTKVRRKNPIPDSLHGLPPTKLLLTWNFSDPEQKLSMCQRNTMEIVTSLFAPYGVITSVRILKPSKEIPCDVKKYLSRYPELTTKSCALVEYESLEGARKALEALGGKLCSTSDDDDLKVIPVNGRGTRKKSGMETDEMEDSDLPDKKLAKKQNRVTERLQYAMDDASFCSSSESDSTPASPILIPRYLSALSFASPGMSFKPTSFSSPHSSPFMARKIHSQTQHSHSPMVTEFGGYPSLCTSPELNRRITEHSMDSGIGSNSPWVQRRRAAAHNLRMENRLLPCSPLAAKKSPVLHGLPNGILRLPHGPDGSRGFHNSIGRGKLVLRH
ncbi:la-related protein 6-like [Discoglossus pictus]